MNLIIDRNRNLICGICSFDGQSRELDPRCYAYAERMSPTTSERPVVQRSPLMFLVARTQTLIQQEMLGMAYELTSLIGIGASAKRLKEEITLGLQQKGVGDLLARVKNVMMISGCALSAVVLTPSREVVLTGIGVAIAGLNVGIGLLLLQIGPFVRQANIFKRYYYIF